MKPIHSIPSKDRLRILLPALCSLLLLSTFAFYYLNMDNKMMEQYDVLSYNDSVPMPVLSVPEGIYDQSFELEIHAPEGYEIYF